MMRSGEPNSWAEFEPVRMNRVIRHRIRNLCAGVRMTMDRIARTTAETHPELHARCDVVKSELDGLRIFSERMDLLFDEMPSPESMPFYSLIGNVRQHFTTRFPLCTLKMEGSEIPGILSRGAWFLIALKELMNNAAEAATYAENEEPVVYLAWTENENMLIFSIRNPGRIPDDTPIDPPIMFTTGKSRHDGIGLAIANRFCKEMNGTIRYRTENTGWTEAEFSVPRSELQF